MSDEVNTEELKIPGPPTGYSDLLDDATREVIANQSWQKFPLRPSSAGSCSRKLAYELEEYLGLNKYPKELYEPNVHRIFSLGHSVEWNLLKEFRLLQPIVSLRYQQQNLELFTLDIPDPRTGKPVVIEGQCDAVFWSEEFRGVMDVKSQKDRFSNGYSTAWAETQAKYDNMECLIKIGPTSWYAPDAVELIEELGEDFIVPNIWQINAYCCADFMVKRGVDHGSVLKYNKNTSEIYELRFKPSMELYEMLRHKFNTVFAKVHAGKTEEVPQDHSLGSMSCAFCPYKAVCWDEQNATNAWFKTLPPKAWAKETARLDEDLAEKLESIYEEYKEASEFSKLSEIAEEDLCKAMNDNKLKKLKFKDGFVYELKRLKNPDRFVLRRSK